MGNDVCVIIIQRCQQRKIQKENEKSPGNPRKGMKGTGLGLKEKNVWVAECTVSKII